MTSLRSRLLLGTTLAVAAVVTVAGLTVHTLMERSLVGEVDRSLAARARLLASTVEQDEDELDVEFDELDMSEFATRDGGGYLELTASDGRVLHASDSLGEERLSPTTEAAWATLPGGARGRLVTHRFEPRMDNVPPGQEIGELTLVLARDTHEVDEALATLATLLGVVGLATLILAGGVLTLVVRRTLRPVDGVSDAIAGIGEDGLATRLDTAHVPDELVPVVDRVNGLLARLDAAFERERAFGCEVAHELRTPLAGLRTILDVSHSRDRDEHAYATAVEDARDLTSRLQTMVDRLLQLARLDAGAAGSPRALDVSEITVEAWEPFARRAAERNLTTHWELDPAHRAHADPELLALILRNLFENAVGHADDAGQVRIASRVDDHGAVAISIANTGSRLSRADAAAATQRLWRGDAARTDAGAHCGLGLAIVERATHALGARLDLGSEPGGEFVATLTLAGASRGPHRDAHAEASAGSGQRASTRSPST